MAQKKIRSDQITIPKLKHSTNKIEPESKNALHFILSLDELKINAKKKIDETAENVRLNYITSGSGQGIVYQEKVDEASDFIAEGYPKLTDNYPFIRAEVNATGKTSKQVVDDIIAAKSTCISKLAVIEEERLKGKKKIDNTLKEEEVSSTRDIIISNLKRL